MEKEYQLNLPIQGKKRPLALVRLLSIETLLRLNPHWIVEELIEDGATFTASLKDHESEKSFQLSGSLVSPEPLILEIVFDDGDFQKIRLFPKDQLFWAAVEYTAEEEIEEDIERHVVLWIRSIKEYLRMYLKNTVNTIFFRYIMNKIILKMTPSQRKISLMLIRITIVELLVILIIVIGYVIFVLKPLGSP